jgi:hypothetical protein
MNTKNWAASRTTPGIRLFGQNFREAWPELHLGDCEPYPDKSRILSTGTRSRGSRWRRCHLADAWRAYHRGDFAEAVRAGLNRSACLGTRWPTRPRHLCRLPGRRSDDQDGDLQGRHQTSRGSDQGLPDDANAHYFTPFCWAATASAFPSPRRWPRVSAARSRHHWSVPWQLAPKHAEAHTAMGLYHAEIIDKVGKLVGSMTYGASADKAMKHFERAGTDAGSTDCQPGIR